MVTVFNEVLTKESIVESPADVVLEGIIIKIEKGLLSEVINPEVQHKFNNLDQEHLFIEFECKFKDKIIKGSDRIPYYSEPMTNSKLAKFLTKYGELKVGQLIKIDFDGDGFSKIKLK